ncbi:MAG: hypothetical protein ACOZDY_02160, partial [Pseudomonadota bacterium]
MRMISHVMSFSFPVTILCRRAEMQRPEFPAVAAVETREAFVVLQAQRLDGDDGAFQHHDEEVADDDRDPVAGPAQHPGDGEHRQRQRHVVQAEGTHAHERKGVGEERDAGLQRLDERHRGALERAAALLAVGVDQDGERAERAQQRGQGAEAAVAHPAHHPEHGAQVKGDAGAAAGVQHGDP